MPAMQRSSEEYYMSKIRALEKRCEDLEALNKEMFTYIHQLSDAQSAAHGKETVDRLRWRMLEVNDHGCMRRFVSHLQTMMLSTAREDQQEIHRKPFEFLSSENIPADVRVQMKGLESELARLTSDLGRMKKRCQKLQEEKILRDLQTSTSSSDHLKMKEDYLSCFIRQTSVQYLSLLSKLEIESVPKLLCETASGLDLRGITSNAVLKNFFDDLDTSTSHVYFMLFHRLTATPSVSPIHSLQDSRSLSEEARPDTNTSYKDEIVGRVIQQLKLEDKVDQICSGIRAFFSALLRHIRSHERLQLTYSVQAAITRSLSGSISRHLQNMESKLEGSVGSAQVLRVCRRVPSLRVVVYAILALQRIQRLAVIASIRLNILGSSEGGRETLVRCLLALKDARQLSPGSDRVGGVKDLIASTCCRCLPEVTPPDESDEFSLPSFLQSAPTSAPSLLILRDPSSAASCWARARNLDNAAEMLRGESGRLEDYLQHCDNSWMQENVEGRLQQQEAMITLLQEKLQRVQAELEDSVPRETYMRMKQKHLEHHRHVSAIEDAMSPSRKPSADVEKRLELQAEQLAAAQESIRKQEEEIRKLQDRLIARGLQTTTTSRHALSASGGSSMGSERGMSIEEELAHAEEELESCRRQISQVLKGKQSR